MFGVYGMRRTIRKLGSIIGGVMVLAACSGGGNGPAAVPATVSPTSPAVIPGTDPASRPPETFALAATTGADAFICVPSVTTPRGSLCVAPASAPTQWVRLTGFSFAAKNSFSFTSGSGAGVGKPVFADVQLQKNVDQLSASFLRLIGASSHTNDVRIIETRAFGRQVLPYREIDLQNATFTKDAVTGGTGGVVSEAFSVAFSAVQYAVLDVSPKTGVPGRINAKNFSILTNTSSYSPALILQGSLGNFPSNVVVASERRASESARALPSVPGTLVASVARSANRSTDSVVRALSGSATFLLGIPGFVGTSLLTGSNSETNLAFANTSEISDFNVGEINGSPFARSGIASGKATPDPLFYDKVPDVNSPSLMEFVSYSRRVPTVELDLVQVAPPLQAFAWFQFSDVFLNTYATTYAAGSGSVDSITMDYAKIRFCYRSTDANGKLLPSVCDGWDYSLNKAI